MQSDTGRPIQSTCKLDQSQPESRLCGLPTELLDMIIEHTLPDPTDFEWSVDRKGTTRLFTDPLLQTSKLLRQKALCLINNKCIWVYVQIRRDGHDQRFKSLSQNAISRLPQVPAMFRYLIDQNSASLHLTAVAKTVPYDHYGHERTPTPYSKDINIILPYNFASLISISDGLNLLAHTHSVNTLAVRWQNIHRCHLKVVENLVLPALLIDLSSEVAKIDRNGNTDRLTLVQVREKHGRIAASLVSRALELLQHAYRLRETGHDDEAGILLHCISCNKSIDWAILTLDKLHVSSYPLSHGGRVLTRNQLRSLSHQIEHNACLGVIHLLRAYGHRWCERHDISEAGLYNFIVHPIPSWNGLTAIGFGERYYARALVYEQMDNSVFVPRKPGSARDLFISSYPSADQHGRRPADVTRAAREMYTACMFLPHNERCRSKLEEYRDILGHSTSMDLQEQVREQFILVECSFRSIHGEKTIWAGTKERLRELLAGHATVSLEASFTQKVLQISPTIEEWAKGTFTEQETQIFLGRGWEEFGS